MSRRNRNSSTFSLFAFQDIITSLTGIIILITMILMLDLINRKHNSPEIKTEETINILQQASVEMQQEIEEFREQLALNTDLIRFDPQTLREQVPELTYLNQKLNERLLHLRKEETDTKRRAKEIQDERESRSSDRQTLKILRVELEKSRKDLEKMRKSNRIIFNPTPGDTKSPSLIEIDANRLLTAKVGVTAPPKMFSSATAFQSWISGKDPQKEYFVLLVKPSGIDFFEQVRSILTKDGFDIGYDLLTSDQTAVDPQTGATW